MSSGARYRLRGDRRESYLRLVSELPLASIRSDEDLAEARAVMDRVLGGGELDPGQEMYLDALSDLVACYEDAHHSIEPASDADLLPHFMEARGVSQAELSRETTIPRSTISEVLSRKRSFSRPMIGKLASYYGIDARVLAANLAPRP